MSFLPRGVGYCVAVSLVCGLLPLVAAAPAIAAPCSASGEFPCSFGITDTQIQPVPNLLKFQARISQAKLPSGEGLFNRVVLNLRRGSETLCTEDFRDVRVSAGTVNLEFGRNAGCELDQVVAENTGLDFQLCIGGSENCLRPIALGATPYALKASTTGVASTARQADVVGIANYAHRVTADSDMLGRTTLGAGYFDFHTPTSAPGLYSTSDFNTFSQGGYMLWAPTKESAPTLHIAARSSGLDTPVMLERLRLEATNTVTLGAVSVRKGGVQVSGPTTLTGTTSVAGLLRVSPTSGGSGAALTVTGNSRFGGNLSAPGVGTFGSSVSSGALTIASGGAHVAGDSDVAGKLNVPGLTAGSATITGDTAVAGNTLVRGALDVGGAVLGTTLRGTSYSGSSLSVGSGGAVFDGDLEIKGSVSFGGSVLITGVDGDFNVPGALTAGSLQSPSARLTNTADFSGSAARPGPSGPIAGELTVGGTSDSGLLRLSAGGATKTFIDVGGASGNVGLNESITLGTANTERLRLQGARTTVTGNVKVSGTVTTVTGPVTGRPTHYVSTNCSRTTLPVTTTWATQNGLQTTYATYLIVGDLCKCNGSDQAISGGSTRHHVSSWMPDMSSWFVVGPKSDPGSLLIMWPPYRRMWDTQNSTDPTAWVRCIHY